MFGAVLLALITMLYLKWGTRQGAVSGLVVGLGIIFALSPFFPMLAGDTFANLIGRMKQTVDIGTWALAGNVLVFIVVSRLTRTGSDGHHVVFRAVDQQPG